MYYLICSECGAHLDPGEKCDCYEEKKKQEEKLRSLLVEEKGSNQITFNFYKEGLN